MFHAVLFPEDEQNGSHAGQELLLERLIRFIPSLRGLIHNLPLVIFDFETTGLDPNSDRIIEVGGIRVESGKAVQEFSYLIQPDIPLPATASKVTGITAAMLEGQPRIEEIMQPFLKFIDGCILVAHNAEFDMAFLRNACRRLGYRIEWPCFCTLKMARVLLPQLESRNLDSLAAHYGLVFEARHRSVGDCKVTSSVLQSLLRAEGQHLQTWEDFQPFAVIE